MTQGMAIRVKSATYPDPDEWFPTLQVVPQVANVGEISWGLGQHVEDRAENPNTF